MRINGSLAMYVLNKAFTIKCQSALAYASVKLLCSQLIFGMERYKELLFDLVLTAPFTL